MIEDYFEIGDRVFWEDPDMGLCSGFYTVQDILLHRDILVLTNEEGSELEVLANECTHEDDCDQDEEYY
jgi:hypothetical protein